MNNPIPIPYIPKELLQYLESIYDPLVLLSPSKITSMEGVNLVRGQQDVIAHLRSLYEHQLKKEPVPNVHRK